MTCIVTPSSPLHCPICGAIVSMVSSLAKRLLNAVAPSISTAGVVQYSPLSLGFPPGSTRISDVELIVGVLPPMYGSHMMVLPSYRPSYHCTIIPVLCAPPWPLGVRNEVNRLVAHSISGFLVLNYRNRSTRSYVLIETTSTSGLKSRAKWSIYWTVIAGSWLSLLCMIIWPSTLWLLIFAASWGGPGLLRSCGDIKMLPAPQLMSTSIRCNSPCWYHIWTSWTMCDESGLAIPHKYWLAMRAFGITKTTFGLSEIWWGWISPNVAINAFILTDCNPTSRSSIVSHRTRYQDRQASFLVVDYWRSAGIWFVLHLLEGQDFRGS